MVHLYTKEYYLAMKKNEINPFTASWMDLEMIVRSKYKRKRQISCDIVYI